jgi:hypothetical protein
LKGDTPAFAPPTSIADMAAPTLATSPLVWFDPTRIFTPRGASTGPVWHAIVNCRVPNLLTLDAGAITPVGLAVGLIAPHSKGDADFDSDVFVWKA